mmetsp:Transcript_31027/g.93056  ORF Transcript_31027/g.93056 Transcript_31027/m.93056 type:complete len:338 (-) Transcript_31027:249-1262(-)
MPAADVTIARCFFSCFAQGIKDDCITEHFYRGSNPVQRDAVTSHLVSCYTNIALASLRSAAYRVAVQACDEALILSNETCGKARAKALYLRARARLEPKSAGAAEQELALCDLERATENDPDNETCSKALKTLRRSIKDQGRKDRAAFRGLFGRGEIYEDDSNDAHQKKESVASAETEKTYTIGETLALADLCAKRGLREEEKGLRELVENQKKAAGRKLDFQNPTEGMREEAKRMGVDLTDPGVMDMLEKLQMKKKARTMGTGSSDSCTMEARGGMVQGEVHQPTAKTSANVFRAASRWWKKWAITHTDKMALHPYATSLVLVVAIRVGALVITSR